MNKNLKQEALKEAIRIGDDLILIASKEKNGLLWNNMKVDYDTQSVSWEKKEGIYEGNSGIILFLAELYNVTKKKKYLQSAQEAMKRVEKYCEITPANSYDFYIGRMGVAFVLLRLYALTGKKEYLNSAVSISKICADFFIKNPKQGDDLLSGISGLLLCLLHLHAANEDDELLIKIMHFTKQLITNARPGKVGLYWDSSTTVGGLCGLAHGSAGIGLVFLELGYYFNNKTFYKIAEEAFAYENYYWNENSKNWPDFRMFQYNPKNAEKYKWAYEGKYWKVFSTPGDMNAWCNGAAGIGLARLRAYELLKKNKYKKDIEKALKKTVFTDITNITKEERYYQNYTLCHALGGNAELFIQALKLAGDKKCEEHIDYLVTDLLAYKKTGAPYHTGFRMKDETIENTNLFLGNAGIGYFLLRTIAPDTVPSILAPSLYKKVKNEAAASHYQSHLIQKILLEKQYIRTICLLEKLLPAEFKNFLKKEDAFSSKKALKQFIIQLSNKLSPNALKCLTDAFRLEVKKVKIEITCTDYALFVFRETYEAKHMQQLLQKKDNDYLKLTLVLMPSCVLTVTKWNWNSESPTEWLANLSLKPEKRYLLLWVKTKNIKETPLPAVTYMLLKLFKRPTTVADVINQTMVHFDVSSEQKRISVQGKLLEQIKQAAQGGLLKQQ